MTKVSASNQIGEWALGRNILVSLNQSGPRQGFDKRHGMRPLDWAIQNSSDLSRLYSGLISDNFGLQFKVKLIHHEDIALWKKSVEI